MKTTGLETTTQFLILAKVINEAEKIGYSLSEYTEAGYNPHSGYVYLWSEDEIYTLGLADYAYHRGEEVKYILSCPYTGEEFIGDTFEDIQNQYEEYAEEAVKTGDLPEDEVLIF